MSKYGKCTECGLECDPECKICAGCRIRAPYGPTGLSGIRTKLTTLPVDGGLLHLRTVAGIDVVVALAKDDWTDTADVPDSDGTVREIPVLQASIHAVPLYPEQRADRTECMRAVEHSAGMAGSTLLPLEGGKIHLRDFGGLDVSLYIVPDDVQIEGECADADAPSLRVVLDTEKTVRYPEHPRHPRESSLLGVWEIGIVVVIISVLGAAISFGIYAMLSK